MAIEHKQLTEMMLMNSTRVLVEAVGDRGKKALKYCHNGPENFYTVSYGSHRGETAAVQSLNI